MLDFIIGPLKYPFVQNALVELILISILSGIIGTLLVLRNAAFISEGISHGIYPGIVLAFAFKINPIIGALITGVFMVLLITFSSKNKKISENNSIAIFFSSAFAVGILLRSIFLTKISIDLESFIIGNIIGVSTQDIILTLIFGIITIVIIVVLFKDIQLVIFDKVFAQSIGINVIFIDILINILVALTIVISIQAVGNILVLALLIIPASTSRLLFKSVKKIIIVAMVLTFLSSVIGLYLSIYCKIASGATIVIISALIFIVTLILTSIKNKN